MTFDEWWAENKVYWIGSSLPAVEAAYAAWKAGHEAAVNSILERKKDVAKDWLDEKTDKLIDDLIFGSDEESNDTGK